MFELLNFLKGDFMDIYSLIIGLISGFLLMYIANLLRKVGYLRIDSTDPDKDYYLLDISEVDLEKIPNKRYIILKVDSKYKKPQ